MIKQKKVTHPEYESIITGLINKLCFRIVSQLSTYFTTSASEAVFLLTEVRLVKNQPFLNEKIQQVHVSPSNNQSAH